MRTALIIMTALSATSLASAQMTKGSMATAALKDAKGKIIGTAMLHETVDGLVLDVSAKGLPKGVHGIHVHSIGKCEAPKFTSAGPHWNPAGHQHGRDNPMGSHAGDIPNLEIMKKGKGSVKAVIPGASFTGDKGIFDADGSAIVIHAGPDDYKTDPSGNSGDRIACGVFTRS
jgi:superoxide dismutase, Cu-Zn family